MDIGSPRRGALILVTIGNRFERPTRDPAFVARPCSASGANAILHRFLDALEQLDDTDREILLMRHGEHLGNSDVAELLGLSQPAAGMRYLRALRRLRAVLGIEPSGS